MEKYNIAGLKVCAEFHYDRMKTNMPKYKNDFEGNPDIVINVTKEMSMTYQDGNPHFTLGNCEYSIAGSQFYTQLLDHDGMMLHSSSIMMDGNAYLFSARSGTGKSTHTSLWQKVYGKDKAVNFNDDKPAIRIINSKAYACGTPFSGKSDINLNVVVPLKAICFIERSETNYIEKIPPFKAIPLIINQTIFKGQTPEIQQKVQNMIARIISTVPVYKLGCTISDEAAILAHDVTSGEKNI
ncbi:MAG: hypothetical protein IIW73_04020 [Clostridia bacterium]|nr:hypothetical protein [Clostridia bacterium]